MLFVVRLEESLETLQLAGFQAQIPTLMGAPAPEGKGGKPGRPKMYKPYITKLMRVFSAFIENDRKTAIYLTTLRGFWADRPQNTQPDAFFTYANLRVLVENLGIHAGVRIDGLLTRTIADVMLAIFNAFTANQSIEKWFKEAQAGQFQPESLANAKEAPGTSEEFVKLGNALQLRALLRQAMGDVVEQSVPGIRDLVKAAVHRTRERPLNPVEGLLAEVMAFLVS
jgi:hypothetical protein